MHQYVQMRAKESSKPKRTQSITPSKGQKSYSTFAFATFLVFNQAKIDLVRSRSSQQLRSGDK